jgi:ATP-dependent Lhr-like helicase
MPLSLFHPVVADWFRGRFGNPTEPQCLGWPHIFAGRDTLIAAPTGSGKTLAAFLACIDRLVREGLSGPLPEATRVLYVSPLKALSHDIHQNLQVPLEEIRSSVHASGASIAAIRAAVRTGDTTAAERQAMLRRPPHILVTTPESFYLLLTAQKGRAMLETVDTVIVDEIHAVARDKRGSHLALSLARLDALCPTRPIRIGLSATQRPMDEIARFLVGTDRVDPSGSPRCEIVDVGHSRELDLGVELPPSELSAVCSNEQWDEVYQRLADLIAGHRSTVVFVNTRRMAERVTHRLTERVGPDAVLSHHGSLSKKIRHNTEQRLKAGELKAVVATASLELGIDIGFIDLVVQIGSPRSIATFLQRVGRSGHALGRVPKGRLFPLTRDELLECAALLRALRRGELDRIELPEAPLDILAQQIVAEAACREWGEDELFAVCRAAWPYRNLARDAFLSVVEMVSEGFAARFGRSGAYLHHDRVGRRIKARRGARLTALTSGGAIPELADYRVVAEPDQVVVGSVDEDFAIESLAGDVFLLGNTSWRIQHVRGGDVVVTDAQGAPPTIPFWRGEAPARTRELSAALSELRRELAARVGDPPQAETWLMAESLLDDHGARQIVQYAATQLAAVGLLPTQTHLLIERFFDESGGMQMVIHAPYGGRINRAWGLALRKRFCRTFDFELQSSADDDGIVFSLGPQQSFPLDSIAGMVPADHGAHLLTQAVLAAPIFMTRWRWNANRSLAVPRQRHGKKVPPPLQRMKADDLLTAVFPQQTACRENMPGPDIPIPDHPLVRQTLDDCLHEAADLEGWLDLLRKIPAGAVQVTAIDTREPSPFAYEILNANPYAFLDDAPLEERRARAVATRRTLTVESLRDLGALDPAAIDRVRQEAWPLVRDTDELYDALMLMGALSADEGRAWDVFFKALSDAGRTVAAQRSGRPPLWITVEQWPMVHAALPNLIPRSKPVDVLGGQGREWTVEDADVELVRGRLEVVGPTTTYAMSESLGIPPPRIEAALLALEHQGFVLRGRFTARAPDTEWCARRLLARIHRLTMDRLRREIEPVPPERFADFMIHWQRLMPQSRARGRDGLAAVIRQLQGMEIPSAAWETAILPARIESYDPRWLDELCLGGEVVWGRLVPPDKRGAATHVARPRAVTRHLPIVLMAREDLGWLRWALDGKSELPPLSARARSVWDALTSRGASFFADLATSTRLLPAELHNALWELVAVGLISQDGFAAVRTLTASRRSPHRGRYRRPLLPTAPRGHGRWTCFPAPPTPSDAPSDDVCEAWARQLLTRYGIVFRDLLTKERATPPWYRVLPVLRRMEARGEVRGGRFVADVGGEQYALPEAVDRLRGLRDATGEPALVCLSAVDPANLTTLFASGPRVPARHGNVIILHGGRSVGTRQGHGRWVSDALSPDLMRRVQAAMSGRPLGADRSPVQDGQP